MPLRPKDPQSAASACWINWLAISLDADEERRLRHLLPSRQRIYQPGACCAVITLARFPGRFARRAVRVRDARLNVARSAPQDSFYVGRSELRVALEQQRADSRNLRRGRRRSAEHAP